MTFTGSIVTVPGLQVVEVIQQCRLKECVCEGLWEGVNCEGDCEGVCEGICEGDCEGVID